MLKTSAKLSLSILGGVIVLFLGFSSGFSAATNGSFLPGSENKNSSNGSASAQVAETSRPSLDSFWEAWGVIEKNYLEEADVSDKQKIEGAIAGLVDSLGDPYSEYFPPEDAGGFREEVQGRFGGIGAQLGKRDGNLTVIAPLKGSPAEKAGLRAGDTIIFVNATSTESLTVQEAVNIIRGPIDSEVTLTILRDAEEEPREFTITRQEIELPTLDYELLENGIIHVQLYQFNANANHLFLEAIREAALDGGRAVILDLRGNPGGYLDVAVDLAGWFLPRGSIVASQQSRDGSEEILRANGNSALVRIPTVILVDQGTASASEILAGALRDHRETPLIGEKSFGKGTVQELKNLSDGSLLKLTVGHWVLPSGRILNKDGLEADYQIEITEEDIENKSDPQLDKAIEVISDLL